MKIMCTGVAMAFQYFHLSEYLMSLYYFSIRYYNIWNFFKQNDLYSYMGLSFNSESLWEKWPKLIIFEQWILISIYRGKWTTWTMVVATISTCNIFLKISPVLNILIFLYLIWRYWVHSNNIFLFQGNELSSILELFQFNSHVWIEVSFS